MIAETGAKNGCGWPTSSVAISQAIVAASVAWRIVRAASRSRSARVRADSRERSAASSIRGCARSESVRGGSATTVDASPPRRGARRSRHGLAEPCNACRAERRRVARRGSHLELDLSVRSPNRRPMGSRPGLRGSSRLLGVPKPWVSRPCPASGGAPPAFPCPRSRPASSPSAWSAPASTPPPWAPARSRRTRTSTPAATAAGRDRDPAGARRDQHGHALAVPLARRDRGRGHARARRRPPPRRPTRRPSRPPRRPRRPTPRPPRPTRKPDPTATPGLGVDKTAPRAARSAKPNRAEGSAGVCPTTASSSARSSRPQPRPLLETASPIEGWTRTTTHADGPLGDRHPRPDLPAPNGVPTPANPNFSLATPGPGHDRRPELLHREVPHPALPPPDLPGRRHPVRHPLGGPRRDQRDRDRLRPQPEHLLRRRARLDAVHARRRGTPTASTPTATARRTRSTRSTRSSPPRATCAPPAPTRTSTARSSPTTTPTGTSSRCSCGRA